MSLKKKILLSFLVAAALTAALSVFLYANFVEIRVETAFLEFTDSVRSKSLQLRRHEKNYLLYAPAAGTDEAASIRAYLGERCDVIILGQQKRSWLRKLFGDNTIARVIRSAPCPVLVVGAGA